MRVVIIEMMMVVVVRMATVVVMVKVATRMVVVRVPGCQDAKVCKRKTVRFKGIKFRTLFGPFQVISWQ